MNRQGVERIKQEAVSRSEAVFFEDDEEITLRDGRKYKIPPATLKQARRIMQLLRTVDVQAVVLNFLPTGNEETDRQREENFFELMEIAFSKYPEVSGNREYLEENVDLVIARKVIDVLIGINGLKK